MHITDIMLFRSLSGMFKITKDKRPPGCITNSVMVVQITKLFVVCADITGCHYWVIPTSVLTI